jgi:hypothetical protein
MADIENVIIHEYPARNNLYPMRFCGGETTSRKTMDVNVCKGEVRRDDEGETEISTYYGRLEIYSHRVKCKRVGSERM